VLRRFLYSQMAMRSAVMIAIGREAPLVRFTVEDDPPSVYLVFRIAPEAVDRLAEDLALPPGLRLAPVRCLAGDEPEHLLTLNVYRVSGITNGMRAEWSVYVEDGSGRRRYLIVDARSSGRSMDPVDVITPASRVEHRLDGDVVSLVVGPPGEAFEASFAIPGDATKVPSSPEWITANDEIYWANGISDRTFYDGGLADADQLTVDPATVKVDDRTRWADYVEPIPHRVLVFREAIEFVVSPWSNVDDLARR
jgi:hypothetical protein